MVVTTMTKRVLPLSGLGGPSLSPLDSLASADWMNSECLHPIDRTPDEGVYPQL